MKKLAFTVATIGLLFTGLTMAKTADAATKDMYRLYNPNSGEHFYTAAAAEKNHLVTVGWKSEGTGWTAPTTGAPVYRLYNPNAGDHHYTLNLAEKNMLTHVGWKDEGIGWYSDTNKAIPLYRAYNPNAKAGSHNYTVNYNEEQNLASHGWRSEGISWYGTNKSTTTPSVNKTDLQTLYTKVKGTTKSDFTDATWNLFQTALANAKNVLNNSKATQSQVNTAHNSLQSAFNGLKHEAKPTPVSQSYTVTINHVDRQTGKVITSSSTTVKAGQSYTANAKVFKFEDKGLNYDTDGNFSYKVIGANSQSKTITSNTTLTFTYNQVHHIFVRATDNYTSDYLIKNPYNRTVLNVEHGQAITVNAPSFSGYVLDERDTPNSSIVLSSVTTDQNIGFGYTHKYNITVNHVDADTNAVLSTETTPVYEGDSFSTPWKNMTDQNYYLCSNDDNTVSDDGVTGVRSITDIKQDKVITFKYKHITLEELNNHIRQDALKTLNEYRQQNGVGTMQFNDIVQKAADIRAQELQTNYSHFRPGGGTFQDLLESLGCYGGKGENIGSTGGFVDQLLNNGGRNLIEQFQGDEGHDGNLLYDKQTLTGISSSFTIANDGSIDQLNEFIGAISKFK